jgi:hypothetical protein
LVWAVNFSHTDAYAKAVRERLVEADKGDKSGIVNALKELAGEFKKGEFS